MPAGVIAVPGLGIGAPQPDEVVTRRPRLRIAVRPSRRSVAGIVFASATVTLLALFAAAVFQTVLVQGQQRLDRLDRRVSQAQDQFDRLRADVAELESPERIVTVAHHRLGMVQPETVTYLARESSSRWSRSSACPVDRCPTRRRWTLRSWARDRPGAS